MLNRLDTDCQKDILRSWVSGACTQSVKADDLGIRVDVEVSNP